MNEADYLNLVGSMRNSILIMQTALAQLTRELNCVEQKALTAITVVQQANPAERMEVSN